MNAMNAINVWATMALWYHSKHQIKVMWASFYPERVIQRGTVIKMWCDWTIKILTKLDLTHLKCPHISYRVYHIEIDETKWLPEVWKFEFHQPVFKNVTLADLNSLQQKGYQMRICKNPIFDDPFHKKGLVLIIWVLGMIQSLAYNMYTLLCR